MDKALEHIVKDLTTPGVNGCNLRFRVMGREDGASRIVDDNTARWAHNFRWKLRIQLPFAAGTCPKLNELVISFENMIEAFGSLQDMRLNGPVLWRGSTVGVPIPVRGNCQCRSWPCQQGLAIPSIPRLLTLWVLRNRPRSRLMMRRAFSIGRLNIMSSRM